MAPLEGRQIKESRTDDFLILCLIARVVIAATSDPNKILIKFTLLLLFFLTNHNTSKILFKIQIIF